MRACCWLFLVGLAHGCDPSDPVAPVPVASSEPAPKPRPEPEPAPEPTLPFSLVNRPDTFFIAQSCLWADPAASAREAQANCKAHKRGANTRYERGCRCDAADIIEVRRDAPAAFYFGCCWSTGDTPAEARRWCDTRIRKGWCDDTERAQRVHAVVGPFERRGPFRGFDSPDYAYLVPSKLPDTGWISDAGEPPCFPDGTLVELSTGPRAIEDVQVGDEVVTLRDGATVLVPVLGIKVRQADALRIFTFDVGSLRLTPNHLVWLDEAWQPASDVQVGDVLRGLDGPRVVRRIDEAHERVTVRTLSVGTPNSFFAEGVWVHNY